MGTGSTSHNLVSSEAGIKALLDVIRAIPAGVPSLFLDLEGVNLCRHGTISLISIFVKPEDCVYLVDVHTLQSAAFTTATSDGTTLKSVLESPDITKVFFDVRNDSDALYHHFGVRLLGVEDVQLMENASRLQSRRRFLNGLARCISRDAPISWEEREEWNEIKQQGVDLFNPDRGGSYEVFNERPLTTEIKDYCVNDVRFLPQLRDKYLGMVCDYFKRSITAQTERRVRHSQHPLYDPHSEDKKYGPWEREWDGD